MESSTVRGEAHFYPTDNVIGPQTTRNDAAVDLLLGYADCVPRIIGVTC